MRISQKVAMLTLLQWHCNWLVRVQSISQSHREFMFLLECIISIPVNSTSFKINHYKNVLTHVHRMRYELDTIQWQAFVNIIIFYGFIIPRDVLPGWIAAYYSWNTLYQGKLRVKSLCLIKHTMKMCVQMKAEFHTFWASMSSQLRTTAILTPGKETEVLFG
jgi:hypothetical protein